MSDNKIVNETDLYHFYDANEWTNSILNYMNTDGYKKAMGELGSDYEKGFKSGLCLAPCVLMAGATMCLRTPKENIQTETKVVET